ncbi:hypothetical protein CATMIT_01911, partial [Catenibacterium mitsuokai DSM 15897]
MPDLAHRRHAQVAQDAVGGVRQRRFVDVVRSDVLAGHAGQEFDA